MLNGAELSKIYLCTSLKPKKNHFVALSFFEAHLSSIVGLTKIFDGKWSYGHWVDAPPPPPRLVISKTFELTC